MFQLLYLSVDTSAELGLAKALSTVTGEQISLNEVWLSPTVGMVRLYSLHAA